MTRPATTPEARRAELINLAENLAAQRLQEGSASAQEIVYYLKMNNPKEQLEIKRLEKEIQMIDSILKQEGHQDANVYNPQGVGGIHMLYVLPEKPSVYDLPENPQTPNSIDLWKDVVRPLGKLAGAGALVGVLGLAAVKSMRGKKDDDENGKGEK